MSVTRLVSQLGMSSHPAAPHRAELGSAQFGSVEQQFAPEVTFTETICDRRLERVLCPRTARRVTPGTRVQHTTHIATNARDREIRISSGLDRPPGARAGASHRRREDFWTSPKIARIRPLRGRHKYFFIQREVMSIDRNRACA